MDYQPKLSGSDGSWVLELVNPGVIATEKQKVALQYPMLNAEVQGDERIPFKNFTWMCKNERATMWAALFKI